jgi:hypothetical protein
MIKPGTIISACSEETPECVEIVRVWCRDNGYTSETVRIFKRDGQVLAELKDAK